jgi:hypothetical protein
MPQRQSTIGGFSVINYARRLENQTRLFAKVSSSGPTMEELDLPGSSQISCVSMYAW